MFKMQRDNSHLLVKMFSFLLLLILHQLSATEVNDMFETQVTVHRFAGAPYDQVNAYWVEGPKGVFIVDTQRLKHQANYLVEEIQSQTSKPVVGILLTHFHPDHTGGLPVLRKAFGREAFIYTSEFTQQDIATDGFGMLAARRKSFGRDFPKPSEFPVPDYAVIDRQELNLAGVKVVARVFEHVDSPSSVVWELPEQGVVFMGDLAVDRKTPSLRGGTSKIYVKALQDLESEVGEYNVGYPGHGEPQSPLHLITQTLDYIQAVQSLVLERLSKKGKLLPSQVMEIKQILLNKFSLDFDTLLFPNEHEINIENTAKELGENQKKQ
jgi:glyoxylase-like metal-dependent hydrolase (beta-lactamase superfamily II)